ncbi:hypothetical protein Tco_1380380 [Tanacetum coccineum]
MSTKESSKATEHSHGRDEMRVQKRKRRLCHDVAQNPKPPQRELNRRPFPALAFSATLPYKLQPPRVSLCVIIHWGDYKRVNAFAGSVRDNFMKYSRPPPDHDHINEDHAGQNPGHSHEALAGTNPEPMHDDFIATVYPKVHESLKHIMEEHVHLENPLSSSGTLSSMKNLDDAFSFDDQFLNDKPMKEEPGKTTVETKAESMVIVPIHQASTSVPPLSTPIIDLSPLKPVSSPLQEPVISANTEATTTTLPLPPPPQQQSTTNSSLASRILTLEQRCADLEKKHKLQNQTTHALLSRSSTWKTSDTREAPSSSSKQKFIPYSEQPVEDVPIPDDMNISDSEDTDTAHLPKIKTKPDWLKPVPEEDRPATPEPD